LSLYIVCLISTFCFQSFQHVMASSLLHCFTSFRSWKVLQLRKRLHMLLLCPSNQQERTNARHSTWPLSKGYNLGDRSTFIYRVVHGLLQHLHRIVVLKYQVVKPNVHTTSTKLCVWLSAIKKSIYIKKERHQKCDSVNENYMQWNYVNIFKGPRKIIVINYEHVLKISLWLSHWRWNI